MQQDYKMFLLWPIKRCLMNCQQKINIKKWIIKISSNSISDGNETFQFGLHSWSSKILLSKQFFELWVRLISSNICQLVKPFQLQSHLMFVLDIFFLYSKVIKFLIFIKKNFSLHRKIIFLLRTISNITLVH